MGSFKQLSVAGAQSLRGTRERRSQRCLQGQMTQNTRGASLRLLMESHNTFRGSWQSIRTFPQRALSAYILYKQRYPLSTFLSQQVCRKGGEGCKGQGWSKGAFQPKLCSFRACKKTKTKQRVDQVWQERRVCMSHQSQMEIRSTYHKMKFLSRESYRKKTWTESIVQRTHLGNS